MTDSPQVQRITSRAELADLPTMTVVIDAFGAVCTKVRLGVSVMGWVRVTTALVGYRHYREPYLPAVVLIRGAER